MYYFKTQINITLHTLYIPKHSSPKKRKCLKQNQTDPTRFEDRYLNIILPKLFYYINSLYKISALLIETDNMLLERTPMAAKTTTTTYATSLRRRRTNIPLPRTSSVTLSYFKSPPPPTMKMTCRSAKAEEIAGVFSVTPPSKADFDYLGQSTKGDLNLNLGN